MATGFRTTSQLAVTKGRAPLRHVLTKPMAAMASKRATLIGAGEGDGRHTVRRARVLRGHGRSGLQEDLPRAAGDGQARQPRRAGHRRGQGRLDARPVARAGAGERREARRPGPRRVRASCAACCATSTATTGIRRPSRRSGASSAAPRTRRTTSRFRRRCSDRWWSSWRDRAARTGARVVVEKPFGEDLASARDAESDPARHVRRARHLPDRPLPRQAAGSQHAVLPLLESGPGGRSGTAPTSRACRSPWPRTSASRAAAASTTRPAPSATSSRTTCFRW